MLGHTPNILTAVILGLVPRTHGGTRSSNDDLPNRRNRTPTSCSLNDGWSGEARHMTNADFGATAQNTSAGNPVPGYADAAPQPMGRRRLFPVIFALVLVFSGIGGQMLRLALPGRVDVRLHSAEPVARVHARPDILDRKGRIIATDIEAPSLYADPALLLDLDEVVEKLIATLPGLDEAELRRSLSDRTRRFVWIRRGLTPVDAQRLHDLGLPGLNFRREPKRVYPAGALVGHIVGHVNVDNRGQAGIERHIDDTTGIEAVLGASGTGRAPVRLSLDLGVQHSVAEELRLAMQKYTAKAAAGLVLDMRSGEIIAAVSLPGVDPNRPVEALDPSRPDRIQGGVFELGSIFKMLTVAQALDSGRATLDKSYETTQPLELGRYTIKDLHASPQPLSVRDIFLHSSNIGAGLLALEGGTERQRAFLKRLGLTDAMRTETGPVAQPLQPQRWDQIETVTISYGHGLAVAPLQFATAAAALLNGGRLIMPTYIAADRAPGPPVLNPETSAKMREIMRLNVTAAQGTGRRADVEGYRVGGKTGTAEMPGFNGRSHVHTAARVLLRLWMCTCAPARVVWLATPMTSPYFLTG